MLSMERNFQLVSTSGNGSFELLDSQGAIITALVYENWFSSRSIAESPNQRIIIQPRNIWHSAFDILVNEQQLGDITFNWKGHILIRINEPGRASKHYQLKSKGFWEFRFQLEDEQGAPVLQLIPAFQWQKLKYNYGVQLAETFTRVSEPNLIVILLACGYAANLYMTVMAASS